MTNFKINRRDMFAGSASVATLASVAHAQAATERKLGAGQLKGDFSLRGYIGQFERLGELDLESRYDLLTGYRIWANSSIGDVAEQRTAAILRQHGLDPAAKLSLEATLPLIESDPVLSLTGKSFLMSQQLKFKILQDHLHANADQYLSEMESADKAGPGSLELNKTMKLPEYTTHEIHIQPGGFVGDPFAGYMYRYGTDILYTGHNEQNETHNALAATVPLPEDRKVRRILDLGCAVGQYATALKDRFPEAEVWGLDVGAPMVRYAHMRASDLGSNVNFVHRLAEDSKFADNHFDIITANILFHEVNLKGGQDIIKEVGRILRPGGVFYPTDFYTSRPKPVTAIEQYRRFWIYRWNHEDWYMDYSALEMEQEIAKNSMKLSKVVGRGNAQNIIGTKV